MSENTSPNYRPELRERAVRMIRSIDLSRPRRRSPSRRQVGDEQLKVIQTREPPHSTAERRVCGPDRDMRSPAPHPVASRTTGLDDAFPCGANCTDPASEVRI